MAPSAPALTAARPLASSRFGAPARPAAARTFAVGARPARALPSGPAVNAQRLSRALKNVTSYETSIAAGVDCTAQAQHSSVAECIHVVKFCLQQSMNGGPCWCCLIVKT